jgi:hypothetical protein
MVRFDLDVFHLVVAEDAKEAAGTGFDPGLRHHPGGGVLPGRPRDEQPLGPIVICGESHECGFETGPVGPISGLDRPWFCHAPKVPSAP